MCAHDCPRCRRTWVVKLRSADGLESVKQYAVKAETNGAPPRTFTTAIAPPGGPAFIERRYELVDRNYGTGEASYQEVVSTPPTPPKPLWRVCELPAGKWCNRCVTTHCSVSPRIVPG